MAPDKDEETAGLGETNVHASFISKEGADVTGDLERTPLEEVLTQIFCARSTGTLTVTLDQGTGELVLWKGEPLACSFEAGAEKREGDDAVLALFEKRRGTFRFTEDLEPREQNVKRSVPELVAEAKKRARRR